MRAYLVCGLALLACQKPVEDDFATVVVHTSSETRCVRLTLNDNKGTAKNAKPAAPEGDVTFVIRLEARDAKNTTAVAAGFGDAECNAISLPAERDQGPLVFGGRLDLYLVDRPDGGTAPDGGNTMGSGDADAGSVDNKDPDAGPVDSGGPDSGQPQVPDAGVPPALLNFNSSVLTSIPTDSTLVFDGSCMGFNTSQNPNQGPGGVCQALREGRKVTMLDGKEALVYAAETITVTATAKLQFYGERPVAFVASKRIIINSKIDLKGNGQEAGAGARSNCSAGNGTGDKDASYGGGAGGSFGEKGGRGGNGGPGRFGSVVGTGGAPLQVSGLGNGTPLQGGCEGGESGKKTRGGTGGGAIQLYAGEGVMFDGAGSIDAPGRAGGAGDAKDSTGGGGGGSGGQIIIQSQSISFGAATKLTANGGSGGSGSIGIDYRAGYFGKDGSNEVEGVMGALSAGIGGEGGSGGAKVAAAGDGKDGVANGDALGNGGGGGGSVGRIFIEAGQFFCPQTKVLVSPSSVVVSPPNTDQCIK